MHASSAGMQYKRAHRNACKNVLRQTRNVRKQCWNTPLLDCQVEYSKRRSSPELRAQSSELMNTIQSSELSRVQSSELRTQSPELRAQSSELRAQSSELRASSSPAVQKALPARQCPHAFNRSISA